MWTKIISLLGRGLRLIRLILPHVFSLLLLVPCFARSQDLPLEALRLPPGFQISVFAELTNPRQLALSESGIVYAGSFRAGNLYGVIDANSDGSADKVVTIDRDLTLPTGIAIQDGDLYVGAVDKLLVYQNIDQTFESSPEPFVLYDELPEETHHGWKYLGFSPEDHLFFNVGAPCNVCEKENPWFATIMSLDLDREPLKPEIFASGVRNTVGFSWHPGTGELWFTDNGRDLLGDDTPSCELNRAPKAGLHFGFPYIHASSVIDPEFGAPVFPVEPPVVELGPHVAPLAMKFYTGTMFPERYRGEIFIAEHGSWNRTPEAGHTGYNITMVNPETGATTILIDGWLKNNVAWGRPTDILEMPDGSLLIADDHANVIYRLTYETP
jgi:glucose/arabinose dehydrogenase